MAEAVSDPSGLSPVARQPGWLFARPRHVAIGCLALLAALGWVYLGLMIAGAGSTDAPLPGGGLIPDIRADHTGLAGWGRATLDVLCRPAFGTGEAGAAAVVAAALMWVAMVMAMMLPVAGPMILAYAEMAETAARTGRRAASPLALTAGYGLVWAGFAVIAAALQVVLTRAALLNASMASASTLFSGAVFVVAGAYQFTSAKHACVTFCQRPAPFFLANWSDKTGDIFRLGVRQGLSCVGCCSDRRERNADRFGKSRRGGDLLRGHDEAQHRHPDHVHEADRKHHQHHGPAGFIVSAVAAHWPVRAG
jgi:predicted metal-binding membrane protein